MKSTASSSSRKRSSKPAHSRGQNGTGMGVGGLAFLAIVVVSLVLVALVGLTYRYTAGEVDRARDAYAAEVAERVAERVGGFLQLQMKTLEMLASDPGLAGMMISQPRPAWEKRALELNRNFAGSVRVRLFPADLNDVDLDARPPLSYSVLETLQLTEAGPTPPPVEAYLVGTPQEHVLMAHRIARPDGPGTVGLIVADFPLQELGDLVRGADIGGGYLELQQLTPDGEPLALVTAGNPRLKNSIAVSHRPAIEESRWHLAYWSAATPGRLSGNTDRGLFVAVAAGVVVLALFLSLLFFWLAKLLQKDQSILTGMLENLQEGRRTRYPPVRLAACRSTMERIRDLVQTGSIRASQSAPVAELGEQMPLSADPLVEDIEPDGGMFGVEEVSLDSAIFRKYDIRGIVETSLTPEVVYETGRAIGSAALAQGERSVIIGRDGRLSGPELADALAQGLRATGCDVIDIGLVPTPVVYFAANTLDCKSGVMVTGSHNPPEYNGMKIVLAGETLAEEGIQDLYRRIRESDLVSGSGTQETVDVVPAYIETITKDVVPGRAVKVAVDCGNGAAGAVAPQLLRALGCDVIELYCDVDGTFPNHHPDPGKPENLVDLVQAVQEQEAEVGLAFDGDGDRLGIVASDGKIIWPDRLMMLFAMDVLNRNSGAEIIYDVKCSRNLAQVIRDFGGSALMWKTGHSLIKAKMRETGALLAGEMSGHIFFKERWFGFDDALYSAARLLEILANDPRSSAAVFAALPDSVNTPEINVSMQEGEPARFMERLVQTARFEDAQIAMIDGLRADFADGWGLVRASNTTPCLVLRFEADTAEALVRIQGEFKQAMQAAQPDLELPF